MTFTRLRPGFPHLTPREKDILRGYARHGQRAAIAVELGISLQAVKVHITNILAALDCRSIGQAALLFDRHERGGREDGP